MGAAHGSMSPVTDLWQFRKSKESAWLWTLAVLVRNVPAAIVQLISDSIQERERKLTEDHLFLYFSICFMQEEETHSLFTLLKDSAC